MNGVSALDRFGVGLARACVRLPVLCALLLALLSVGCLGSSPDSKAEVKTPEFSASFEGIEMADAEIMRVAYSSFKHPAGFYSEDLQGGSIYYENSLNVPSEYHGPPFCPLCTEDRQEALGWSEDGSRSSAYYRDLVDERETERYFEFRRRYSKNPADVVLSRVHKCSYLDCSGCNPSGTSPTLGRLSARPIDEPAVQKLAEYLWYLDHYNASGAQALTSLTRSSQDEVSCAIYHLAVQGGDFGLHDRVYLLRTVYTVSRADGKIALSSESLRTVVGRYNENPIPGSGRRAPQTPSGPFPPAAVPP